MEDIYINAMYILDEDTILIERVLRLENTGAYDAGVFPDLTSNVMKITSILNCKQFGFWRVKKYR